MEMNNKLPALTVSKLFQEKSTSDIRFIFPNELKEECECDCNCDLTISIPAHQLILSLGSPVYQRMFSKPSKTTVRIEITDTTASAFHEFLQVFYLTNVNLTPENIEKVLRLLDKYEMPDSFDVVSQFMMDSVTVNNCIYYLELTLDYNLSIRLLGVLRQFIRDNVIELFDTDAFRYCTPAILKNILELYDLKCMEEDIFHAAMRWAKAACIAKGIDATDENHRIMLGDCFYLIRFPTMSIGTFSGCLGQYPTLLNTAELLDILQFLISKKSLTVARSFSSLSRIIDIDRY